MSKEHGFDLMAFGAHPDDVELFAGGTIAKSVAQGMRVAIVDLTRGELGTRGTAETRATEAATAQAILGVEHRENLDLGDGFFEVNEASLRAVIEVLRRLRPKKVLANAWSDRHPDHGRGAELVHRSAFLSGLPKIDTGQDAWRPEAVYHGIQDHWLEPDFVVEITGYEDIKARAIAAYATQFHNPDVESNEPATPISSPEFLQHLQARDVAMGRLAGVKLGEGFQVKRPPAVDGLGDLR
ncbi:MAG: bacillithiol biosynthesis deacetylase BshB1 [Flavobacteriales bacterium]